MNSSLRAARKMEAERNRQEADATAAMEKTSDDKETHPVEYVSVKGQVLFSLFVCLCGWVFVDVFYE